MPPTAALGESGRSRRIRRGFDRSRCCRSGRWFSADLTSGPTLRTGGAALVGKRAVVLERIANHEGVGRVRIDGEVWTARSLDDDQVIEPGTTVEVVDIKGATALVME